jgi:hypothetical protein
VHAHRLGLGKKGGEEGRETGLTAGEGGAGRRRRGAASSDVGKVEERGRALGGRMNRGQLGGLTGGAHHQAAAAG